MDRRQAIGALLALPIFGSQPKTAKYAKLKAGKLMSFSGGVLHRENVFFNIPPPYQITELQSPKEDNVGLGSFMVYVNMSGIVCHANV